MKFTVDQNTLRHALATVQGVSEKKSTIPILQNLLLEASGTGLKITGTNLDVTATHSVDIRIDEPGSICVLSRKLFDIVRNLPSGDVSIETDPQNWTHVKCGRSKFKINGAVSNLFPETPRPPADAAFITLKADTFAEMVHRTSFAITMDLSRFALSGAKFIVDGLTATMVTTDGHRLSFIERDVEKNDRTNRLDLLIPRTALLEAAKMAQSGGLRITEDLNHIFFDGGNVFLAARKLTGQFPNYEMVMPKDNDKCVIADGGDLKAAVRRVSLMSDPRNRSLRVTAKEGEFNLTAASSEEGEGEESLAVEYGGEETVLGFNHQYLTEFLNLVKPDKPGGEDDETSTGGTKITVNFKNTQSQVELQIAGDDRFKYIVMPLRV